MVAVSPPPIHSAMGSLQWLDWFERVNASLEVAAWTQLDFAGSNITDIVTRNHNNLNNISGGAANDYYHITAQQEGDLGNGATGSFTTTDGKTVTVTRGIITAIV